MLPCRPAARHGDHHISVAKVDAGEAQGTAKLALTFWLQARRSAIRAGGRLKPRRTMNLKGVILFAVLSAAVVVPVSVQAGGWGRGPSFGGYHAFSQPIPRKPLAGAQMAAGDVQRALGKAGTNLWDATKRPFPGCRDMRSWHQPAITDAPP